MVYSKIDQFYRSLLLSKFFTKGWGKPDNLKRIFEFRKILSNRESCQTLVEKDYPISIDKDYRDGDCRIMEGHFKSPFVEHMPGIMPREVETASFQAILPLQWQHPTLKPICIHLAGTGDHFFWRRRMFTARPLLKNAGIASILLENPYYGSRKPKAQLRSSLHNVSDLFVMGGALVLESMALLNWCERQGWGPFGLSGVSMGGHNASLAATVWPKPISVVPFLSWTSGSTSILKMASLAATNWERPISLVPLLSWSTASCVFTQGVMSGAIPWQLLQEQFFKNNLYNDEISKLIVSPERAYQLGQQFVINYSQDLEEAKKGQRQENQQQQQQNISKTREIKSSSSSSPSTTQSPTRPVLLTEEQDGNISSSTSTPSSPSASPTRQSSSTAQDYKTAVASDTGGDLNLSVDESSATGNSSSIPSDDVTTQQESQQGHQKARSLSPPREEARRLTLNYAQTKQSQQSLVKDKSSSSSSSSSKLTLGHAVAKSKILFSRKKDNNSADVSSSALKRKAKNLQEESYEFMRGVMDECTHLGNFSVPVDPELVIIVSAKQDAYIPREGVLPLDQLWPGCEVRYVDQGHIGAVLLHQDVFRKAVTDAFDKQIQKYYPDLANDMKRIRHRNTAKRKRRDS